MVDFYLPGELSRNDIKLFLQEAIVHYPYLFERDYLDAWSDKLSKYAHCACIKTGQAIVAACLYYCNEQTQVAYITLIAVLPGSIRGSGYEVFHRCLLDSKNLGMKKMRLEVLKSNFHAQRFYLRQGFVFSGEHDNKLMMEMNIE